MVQAAVLSSEGDQSYAGMKGDIIQAVDRRMDLLAFIPGKGHMVRNFIGWAFEEARRRRRKPIFLAPPEDLNWIHSSIMEARGSEHGREGIVTIPAKVLSCIKDSSRLDPSDLVHHCMRIGTIRGCPLQSGFDLDVYRDIKRSGGNLLNDMGDELREMGMCPARLALDLAVEADAVIADYSFFFTEDPKSVMELLEKDMKDRILVIYDPASLVHFLKGRFSYSLSVKDLTSSEMDLTPFSKEERIGLEAMLDLLVNIAERTDPKKQIERRLLIEGFRERMGAGPGRPTIASLLAAMEREISGDSLDSLQKRRRTKELYMLVKHWMGQYSGVSRTRRESEEGDSVEVSIIDLSLVAQPVLSGFSSVMLLGDTLYPHTIYSYILGMRPDRTMNRSYVEGDSLGGTSIHSMGNVDTSFKHRSESSYRKIVENLSRICETTQGLKIALFPSYYLLDQAKIAMADQGFQYPVVEETRGSSREERQDMLNEIKVGGDLLALSVQGGYISRSLEDGSISPGTVILVGLHIPPPDPSSSQMKLHLQKKYGPNIGHIISVLMPAIVKVMKVVSAMGSSELERRNLVVLMDRRYQDRRILECLPRFYEVKLLDGPNEFDGNRFLSGGGPP